MQVEVSTDNRIRGSERLFRAVAAETEAALARFADRLTRVEVHLSDINGPRGGTDKRCVLEARAANRRPTAVSHQAGHIGDAVRGAADKMCRHLESTLGRLSEFDRGESGRHGR